MYNHLDDKGGYKHKKKKFQVEWFSYFVGEILGPI